MSRLSWRAGKSCLEFCRVPFLLPLYLDGRVDSMTFPEAATDMFPDRIVLTEDSSY